MKGKRCKRCGRKIMFKDNRDYCVPCEKQIQEEQKILLQKQKKPIIISQKQMELIKSLPIISLKPIILPIILPEIESKTIKFRFNKPLPQIKFPIPYQRKVYNLDFLLKSQYWNLEKIQELQLEGFKAIVDFARIHCPYYKDLPEVNELDDVKKLPVLTKKDIHEHFNEILIKEIPYEIEETGGTVSRIKVAKDKILIRQLGLKRYMTWYGLSGLKPWRAAHLWGSIEGSKFVYHGNYLWMPVEQLNNKFIAEKYLRAIKHMKPDFFHAYALPLVMLARYANELNIHPYCKVVRSECETLTSSMRNEIELAFRIEYGIFNLYGSRDLGAMAQDCKKHRDLHYFAERYIIESIDERLLYTDMFNYAFPLIRYENQDIGEFGELCDCELGLPTLKPIIGRILHYLKNKNNAWVSAFVFYLPINYHDIHYGTKTFDWIESFQIRQREIGKITLLIKPWQEEEVPKNMDELKNIIRCYIKPEDFDFDVEIVDKIPLSRSGKQISVDTTLLREWEK